VDKAIHAYRKAIEIDSRHKNAHCGLAKALREKDELDKAIASFRKAIEIDPGNIGAYNGLGGAQSDLGEIDEAIASFRKAIEIDPKNIGAYSGLGNVLSDHGEIDQAIASFRKAIEFEPKAVGAYRALSKNKKFIEYDDDIKSMESLYANEGNSDKAIMNLAFGLGKAYEDLGQFDKSMDFILQGTRLKRASLDYSTTDAESFFGKIKKTFSAEFFSDRKGMGNPDETPIFILGMPRSGTSLTEQILASHPGVYGAGELKYLISLATEISRASSTRQYPAGIVDLDSMALENYGKEYIARIRHHSKATKYITDKMPHNFLYIGLIKVILPNARIVRCARDPMDNCLSIFKNLFGRGHEYSYDLAELGQYYNLYLNLMEYWENTLPGFIYELNYERLVADQENQTRKLLEFCQLPWDDACLDFHKTRRKVNTASNEQVRRPIYKDSVKLWKRYEKQLEPLRSAIYDN